MRPINITFLLGALCCASVLQAAEDGFEPLFGGDGLNGWKVSDWSDLRTPQKVKGTPWKLEDGVLYGLNKRTWIMSPERYGDFVLKLETKITRGSNGGIGLRFPQAFLRPLYIGGRFPRLQKQLPAGIPRRGEALKFQRRL